MKSSTVVLAARPALISFSPGKKAMLRRLPITLWQTDSWIKKIRLRKQSGASEKTKTLHRWFYDHQKTKTCD